MRATDGLAQPTGGESGSAHPQNSQRDRALGALSPKAFGMAPRMRRVRRYDRSGRLPRPKGATHVERRRGSTVNRASVARSGDFGPSDFGFIMPPNDDGHVQELLMAGCDDRRAFRVSSERRPGRPERRWRPDDRTHGRRARSLARPHGMAVPGRSLRGSAERRRGAEGRTGAPTRPEPAQRGATGTGFRLARR